MKIKYQMKLITALLLAIGISMAHAQEFYAKNAGGGQIRLTMANCPEKGQNWFVSYIMSPNGKALYGCWALISDNIHVTWDDGDKRIYPAAAFDVVPGTEVKKKGSSL